MKMEATRKALSLSELEHLLQQVEMWLCHVYFCHCHAHVYYVILSKKFLYYKILLQSRSSRLICHHKAWIVNTQHKRIR